MMRSSLPWFLAALLAVLCGALTAGQAASVPSPKDEDCLACHGDPQLKTTAGRSLYVDGASAGASIHGQAGQTCVDCHADLRAVKDFPHAEKLRPVDCASCHAESAAQVKGSVHGIPHDAPNPVSVRCQDCHGTHDIRAKDDAESRVYAINIPDTCTACHLTKVTTPRGREFVRDYEESVHYKALAKSGLSLSATCVNCHGGHDVRIVGDPDSRVSRQHIIRTCGRCHAGIERDYLEGVHGKDYAKGSQDVPVCTDCHSEHAIQSPETLSSRVYATKVAGVCARCHDDERLARQYGFLTSRLKSYSNSYHGTASSFGETRVANCASCHGHHDIRISADPKSWIYPGNLAKTCGTCHAGAGENFAKGKVHVLSVRTENRWAHLVKVFYIIAIAGLISAFLAFIAADLYRRARLRWKR